MIALHGAARVLTHHDLWYGPKFRSDQTILQRAHGAGGDCGMDYGLERVRCENQALRERLLRLEDELRQATEDMDVLRAGHRVLQRSLSVLLSPLPVEPAPAAQGPARARSRSAPVLP